LVLGRQDGLDALPVEVLAPSSAARLVMIDSG
jgi:hypothetical protein